MTDRLENFRAAYFVLQERVQVALRIQIGDLARLNHQRDEVLSFAQSAQQVHQLQSKNVAHLLTSNPPNSIQMYFPPMNMRRCRTA